MKDVKQLFFRIVLLSFILTIWLLVLNAPLSKVMNLSVIVGGVLLSYPLVWFGRKILYRHQTIDHAVRTTTFVHFGLGFTFGIPVVRAMSTHQDWYGRVLPVPSVIGLVLGTNPVCTGIAFFR